MRMTHREKLLLAQLTLGKVLAEMQHPLESAMSKLNTLVESMRCKTLENLTFYLEPEPKFDPLST